MRKALLLAGLLLLVALSGCSDSGGDDGTDPTGEGDGRTSDPRTSDGGSNDGPNGTAADPPHTDVPLLDAPFEGAATVTQTYEVTVTAANLTNVDFTLSLTDPVSVRQSVTASLDGCGEMQDGTIALNSGGTTTLKARLCKSLAPGTYTLTVTAQGLLFTGSVRLVGQVPK